MCVESHSDLSTRTSGRLIDTWFCRFRSTSQCSKNCVCPSRSVSCITWMFSHLTSCRPQGMRLQQFVLKSVDSLATTAKWQDLSPYLFLYFSSGHRHWQWVVLFVSCLILSNLCFCNCSCLSYPTGPCGCFCMDVSRAPVLSDAAAAPATWISIPRCPDIEEAFSGSCSQSHQPLPELWGSPLWLNGRNPLSFHVSACVRACACLYVLVCRSTWSLSEMYFPILVYTSLLTMMQRNPTSCSFQTKPNISAPLSQPKHWEWPITFLNNGNFLFPSWPQCHFLQSGFNCFILQVYLLCLYMSETWL